MTTADGKTLLHMRTWMMAPESPEVAENDAGAKGYRVSSIFDSPAEEHYYGLGQQQKGWMDLRDHEIRCWHDYVAIGGQDVCVPFMVSSRGYGLVWDNPSKTTVDLGFNGRNLWSSEVGDRVSYFVIAGETSDEIYQGYRLLTGITHMLPRAIYGYIQSKAIYPTQEQILDVAKGYRARKLPLDVLVVDFLNMTRQGEMDLDPKRWPDPAAMNRELHAMGVGTLLSVWPHFAPGTQFYDMLLSKGWLIHARDGKPDSGGFRDTMGPNIDTTNPEAANWFWEKIRDRYVKPYGFDYIWLDETEPDIDPAKDVFFVGSGTRFYNVYPLFHTASVYQGFRRDFGDSRRVMILARASSRQRRRSARYPQSPGNQPFECSRAGEARIPRRMNRRRVLASSALAMHISLWASSTARKYPLPFFRTESIAALNRSSSSCPSLNRSFAASNSRPNVSFTAAACALTHAMSSSSRSTLAALLLLRWLMGRLRPHRGSSSSRRTAKQTVWPAILFGQSATCV